MWKGPGGDVAVGVTTTYVGCAQGYPTVYADVAAASTWIRNAIQVGKERSLMASSAGSGQQNACCNSAKPHTASHQQMALLMWLLGLLKSGTTADSPIICTQCLCCSLSFTVDAA